MPNQTTDTDNFNNDEFFNTPLPENWGRVSDDVIGYWDPEKSSIRCKPMSVKIFDGQEFEGQDVRPSCLILVELTAACLVKVKDENGQWQIKKGNKGDVVGVWYKPGMRAIRRLSGVECHIQENGERDTGKGNPMKMYDIRCPDASSGKKLIVSDDTREETAGMYTDFTGGTRQNGQRVAARNDKPAAF
jgi:hypothetical protein